MPEPWWTWVAFNVFIIAMLVIDLVIVGRRQHVIGFRESLTWTGVWIGLALAFNVVVYYWLGPTAALEYLTGYLIEKSLSVDNIFVFILIFSYFRVAPEYHHKVLFWGVLGALVMRAVFIVAGVTLVNLFHWIEYVFGIFLVYTGIRIGVDKGKEIEPEKNPVLKFVRRHARVTESYEGGKFVVRRDGRRYLTPLFIVVIVVETTDLVFAVDSIPAILAVTRDPFILYTSNVFAILGLRSLYFALAGIMRMFHYLHYGLSAILVFVGVKMVISDFVEIPTGLALGVVAGILSLAILASVVKEKRGGGGEKRSRAQKTP
jgi:tellurite resistance protein TerC